MHHYEYKGFIDIMIDDFVIFVIFTVPTNNKVLFSKLKWHFDGQDSFEDYVVHIGGYSRTLGIVEVSFKNTLFQSFRPPC